MKILTTRAQLRHTLESGKRVIFEPAPPSAPIPPTGPYIVSITPQISSPYFEDPLTITVTGGRFTGASDVAFLNEGSVDGFTVDSDSQITVTTFLYGNPGEDDNLFVTAADMITTSPMTPATAFQYAYAWPEDCCYGPIAVTSNRIWSISNGTFFYNNNPPVRFLMNSLNEQDAGWPANSGDAGVILQDANYVYYVSNSAAVVTRIPINGDFSGFSTLVIPAGVPPLGSNGSGSGGLGLVNSCISGSKLYMVWGAQGKWNGVTTNYPQLVIIDLAAWSPTGFAIYPITTVTSPVSFPTGVCVANGLILVPIQEATAGGYAGKLYYSSVSTPGTFTKISLSYIPCFCVSSGNFGYFMQDYFQPSGVAGVPYRGLGWQRHLIIADCTTGTPVISYVDMAADDANFKFLSNFERDPIPWVSSNYLYVHANVVANSSNTYSVPYPFFYIAKRVLGTGAAYGGGSTPPPVVDPNFSSTVLLCGFEGKNKDRWILDESADQNGNAYFTAHGAQIVQATISTAQKKFGSTSLKCGGAEGIYWDGSNADWDFGTSPFTVECWFYLTSSAGQQCIVDHCIRGAVGGSGIHGQWHLWIDASGHVGFRMYDFFNQSAHDIPSTTTPTLNAWHHVAVDFDGSNYRLYMDGSTIGVLPTSTYSTTLTSNYAVDMAIGGDTGTNAFYFTGFIDEIRISKNLARYASSSGYTVPTAAFPRGPKPLPANGIFMKILAPPWTWEVWPFTTGAYSGGKLFLEMTSWDYGASGTNGGLMVTVNEDLTSPVFYPVPTLTEPANDLFANAQTVTLGTPTTGNVYYATGETNEQWPPVWDITTTAQGIPTPQYSTQALWGVEHTIWYTFTPSSTGDYTITYQDKRGESNFDLTVWSGSTLGSLTNVYQNLGGGFNDPWIAKLHMTAGTIYHLAFDRFFYYGIDGTYGPDLENYGNVLFTIASASIPGAAPAFVNAGLQKVASGGMGGGSFTVTPDLPAGRTNGNLLIAIARPSMVNQTATVSGGSWLPASSSVGYFGYGMVAFCWVDGTEVPPVFTMGNNTRRLDISAQVFQYTGVPEALYRFNPFGKCLAAGWYVQGYWGAISYLQNSAAPVNCPAPTLTYPYSTMLCISMYEPGSLATPSTPPGFTLRNTTPATATPIFTATLNADTTFAANTNYRVVIPATYLTASGSNIRISVQGLAGASAITLNPMYVGHADQSVNPWNFDGTQVHAYFNQGDPNNLSIASGATLKSDIIPYNLDHTRPLVISFWTTGSGAQIRTGPSPGGTTMTSYSKTSASEASTSVVTGYAGTTGIFLVVKIEVMDQHSPSNISDQSFVDITSTVPATTLPETPDGWNVVMLELRSQ